MLKTEYVRSLQSSYERVALEQLPDERRYQYCILSRGGIGGLLPCSLRYINGEAFLYYDITSRQNVAQLYCRDKLTREWIQEFFWSYGRIRQELARFLLDTDNIIWNPEHVFQDVSSRSFFFLYMPYREGESDFARLLEFMLERIDYDDEKLVECVYNMYEQYDRCGESYLQQAIMEDAEKLQNAERTAERQTVTVVPISRDEDMRMEMPDETSAFDQQEDPEIAGTRSRAELRALSGRGSGKAARRAAAGKKPRHGLLGILGIGRGKDTAKRTAMYDDMQDVMDGLAVAEETPYNEDEYGQTVYVEEQPDPVCRLYTPDGRIVHTLEREVTRIGKQRGDNDLVMEGGSVSRLHARIICEEGVYYIEDLNSTNGTFKNGLRMQAYERRRLEKGDELRFGQEELLFR